MFQLMPVNGPNRRVAPGAPPGTILPRHAAHGRRTRTRFWPVLALFAALALPLQLPAAELAGVTLAETVRSGDSTLLLNGAGVRSRMFIKVYVGALYLTQKTANPAAIFATPTPRRVELHLLRPLDSESLQSALVDGLTANHDAGQLAALRSQIDALSVIMRGIGKVKVGDVVAIDLGPDAVQVALNGQAQGRVAGAGFADALLRVWLGDKPADTALKQAMLGIQPR